MLIEFSPNLIPRRRRKFFDLKMSGVTHPITQKDKFKEISAWFMFLAFTFIQIDGEVF